MAAAATKEKPHTNLLLDPIYFLNLSKAQTCSCKCFVFVLLFFLLNCLKWKLNWCRDQNTHSEVHVSVSVFIKMKSDYKREKAMLHKNVSRTVLMLSILRPKKNNIKCLLVYLFGLNLPKERHIQTLTNKMPN